MERKRYEGCNHDRILIFFILIFSIASVILAIILGITKYVDSKNDYDKVIQAQTLQHTDADYDKMIQEMVDKYSVMEGINTEQLQLLAELCRTDRDVIPILTNFTDFPERVIKMVLNNKETLEFLINYKERIDQPIDENINISSDCVEGEVPHFIQWDQRWGYYPYGNGVIGYTACGPTCLSMVYVYFTNDQTYNPLVMTKYSAENQYYEDGVGTKWTLMTEAASNLGLRSKNIDKKEDVMISELNQGHKLILSVGPGDFTDTGHFIVIKGYENGAFLVNDPNSYKNSKRTWQFDEIKKQIKAVWTFWR